MPINPDDLLLVSRGGSDYKYPADSFQGPAGETGENGEGVPEGGVTGQILAKASETSFDTEWIDNTPGIADGGDLNQVLAKASNIPYETKWITLPEQDTYRIETDPFSTPQVQLVDKDDNFSNVHFYAGGSLSVDSNAAGITYSFDASNFATKLEVEEGDDGVTQQLTTDFQDADAQLQLQINSNEAAIEQLTITKGSASLYRLKDIQVNVASRPGELYVDATQVSSINYISIAPEDLNGAARPLADTGDILELVKADNTAYRFEALSHDQGNFTVSHIGGTGSDLLMASMTFNVYIYPQNKATASIDYVDDEIQSLKDYTDGQDSATTSYVNTSFLKLTGGTLTGTLVGTAFTGLKSSGPVITVGPASDNIKASIDADGNASFNNVVCSGHLEAGAWIKGNNTALDGRAGLLLTVDGSGPPIVVGSGSSYLPAFSVYGYDNNSQGNRRENFVLYANGKADFKNLITTTNDIHFTAANQFIRTLNGSSLKFVGRDAADANRTFIHFATVDSTGAEGDTDGYFIKIYHLADPESPRHAATKKYVDEEIAKLEARITALGG